MAIQDFDILVESTPKQELIDEQVCSMFDAPISQKLTERFKGQCPDWDEEFSIGLVVGPSGSGKSTVARNVFGNEHKKDWVRNQSVVSQFSGKTVAEITGAFSSVGFNTVTSWVKPREVLSNGEGFRVDLAAALLEQERVLVDEFTSVVDRQVAEIACYAASKHVRKSSKRLVAVTCHYDVIEWLQPDWVLDMATRQLTRRLLRRREPKTFRVARVQRHHWESFSRYHYLTATVPSNCIFYGSFLKDTMVGIHALRVSPVSSGIRSRQIVVARTVVHPDYQGLGINGAALDSLASCLKCFGHALRMPPAHPALVQQYNRSPKWRLEKNPSKRAVGEGSLSTVKSKHRPCAIFSYCGEPFQDKEMARKVLNWSQLTE